MSNALPQQYAYRSADYWLNVGQEPPKEPVRVEPGTLVNDFRGETWTYEGVARPAYGNSTGRVAASAACDAGEDGQCPHMWHRDGIERREFFPSVFNLYLGDVNGVEA